MLQKHKYEVELQKQRTNKKSIGMSTRIVENLLNRKISDLFEQLDSDLDGMISANRINIGKLEPKKLALLTPLLIEMEELNLDLDKENFTHAVKRLIKNLSISEKDYLLGVETKKKVRAFTGSMKDCTFRVRLMDVTIN